jgi:hypothetical protein
MPFNNQETINILQQLLTNSKDIILGALGAIIGLSGVTAYQILILAESRFAKYIVDKFTKKD